MNKLAVFDLDGTLFEGNIITAFLLHHRKHKVNRLRLYLYFASHSLLVLLWKIGLYSAMSMRGMWAKNMSWLMTGMSIEDGHRCFEWIADNYVVPQIRQDVYKRVLGDLEDGFRVILLSGTPLPLLKVITHKLGLRECVGTPLKTINGKYNGRIEPPVAQGPGKIERLKEYLSDQAEHIDWLHSYAYADSITDEGFLSLFGNPVAVYPDPALADLATERNWHIFGSVRDPKTRKLVGVHKKGISS